MVLDSISVRIDRVKQHDIEKANLLVELASQLNALNEQKQKVQTDLELSQYLCAKQSEDLKVQRKDISTLHKSMSCDPFVLALIDGDVTQFVDDYTKRGAAGGHDAARDLRQAVNDYFQPRPDFPPNTKIIIHIFANLAGIIKGYPEIDPAVLRQFIQGFNREHALSHFIDAGDDKEAADSKVKEEMALFYNNTHCKYILFAGSGDNSYAGFLRQYTLTSAICSRLVLIESTPFASKLGEVADKFEKTKFKTLFRDMKSDTGRLSFRDDASGRSQRSLPTSYASTVKQAASALQAAECAAKESPTAGGTEHSPYRKIYQNKYGQRVDRDVRPDKGLVTSLKPRKLCNRHFLTRCNYVSCLHSHDATLTAAQTEALRYIARLSPCQTLFCEDPDCVAGHRCMAGAKCDRRGSNCWFSEDMHHVDTAIVGCIPA